MMRVFIARTFSKCRKQKSIVFFIPKNSLERTRLCARTTLWIFQQKKAGWLTNYACLYTDIQTYICVYAKAEKPFKIIVFLKRLIVYSETYNRLYIQKKIGLNVFLYHITLYTTYSHCEYMPMNTMLCKLYIFIFICRHLFNA